MQLCVTARLLAVQERILRSGFRGLKGRRFRCEQMVVSYRSVRAMLRISNSPTYRKNRVSRSGAVFGLLRQYQVIVSAPFWYPLDKYP